MPETQEIIPKTLYVFIDESGNFDFTPKGTKHYLVNGFATFDPVTLREELVRLRYQLLREGYDHDYFHASEDPQFIRDEVFRLLKTLDNTYELHTVWVQKNKTHSSLYKEAQVKKNGSISYKSTGLGLYQKLIACLLQYIFVGKANNVDRIVIVIGALFTGDKKKIFLKTLKHYLKTHFEGVASDIYHHSVSVDLNCQLADYCSWAQYVRLERGEERPHEIIKTNIKSEFDYFRTGNTEYYTYEN